MAPKKQHKQQQQPKQQQPHQQPSQQQQQQQQYPVPKWTDYNTFPPATEERVDQVFAWFTTRLLPLPNDQQLQYARAAAVHLARALQVHGMADAVAAVGGPEISEAVARVITHHLPAWSALSDLVDPAVPAMGTIEQWLSSAATLANQAGFTWRPSAPREDPPQQQQQQPQPQKPAVIEVLDTDSTEDDFSPPPRGSAPSKPHASKSVAFDCDAPSRSRTAKTSSTSSAASTNIAAGTKTPSRSEPLWQLPRTSRSNSRAQELEGDADKRSATMKAEDDDPVFSTHNIPLRDRLSFFSANEVLVLADLPQYLLCKKEDGFHDAKRALQQLARWCIRYQEADEEIITEFFRSELRVVKGALSIEHADELHLLLGIFADVDGPRSLRLDALARIGEIALAVDPHLYVWRRRLRLARLSTAPTNKEEVARWKSGSDKRNVVPREGYDVPFRAEGF